MDLQQILEHAERFYPHRSALVCVPDTTWGEAIKAIVVLKPGLQVSADDIMEYCRSHIAHFKVPRAVEFYTAALPKSGSGKILKRELCEKFWAGQERMVH